MSLDVGPGALTSAKIGLDLLSATNPVTFSLGQAAGFAQRLQANPTAAAIEAAAFLLAPITAGLAPIAIDLLGIGENVSAGDIERLQRRLQACQDALRAQGVLVPLGSFSGKQLGTIEAGIRFIQRRDTSPRSLKTIRAGDSLLRQGGYSQGYLDPRIRQDGVGGPAFRRLQRAIEEAQ